MASPASPSGPTNLGVAPNVGGLLCYMPCCIGLLFSIVAAVIEKQSRFLRFHAFQSLLLHAVLLVLGFGIGLVFGIIGHVFPMMGGLLSLLVNVIFGLGGLGLAIFMMIKAYGGEEWEIPGIGPLAKGWV